VVLSDRTGMKGTRVDSATTSIGGEELRKGGVKVVRSKQGNDVLVTIRNDKEMMRTNSVEVVFPSRAWKYTRLRAGRTRSMFFCPSIHYHGR